VPSRYIKETICTSETLAALSDMEEVTFYRLLVSCDDFGRFFASPRVLRPRLYPLRMDRMTEAAVEECVHGLARAGLVTLYGGEDGKPYLYLTNWFEHNTPRAKASKFPEPPSDATTCAQTYADVYKRIHKRADVPVFGFGFGDRNRPTITESSTPVDEPTRACPREADGYAPRSEELLGDGYGLGYGFDDGEGDDEPPEIGEDDGEPCPTELPDWPGDTGEEGA
jgi:hypothetical protein